MALKQLIDFKWPKEEFKKAIDEGMEMADKFEQALKNVGVEQKAIDNSEEQTKVKDILRKPMELVSILKELNIPISQYLGIDLKYSISKDFIWKKLTPIGAERIRMMGNYYADEGYSLERAEMLADIGDRCSD